jgi:hypothetical protein
MPKFIRLTERPGGETVWINPDRIVYFKDVGVAGSDVMLDVEYGFSFAESSADIRRMIRENDCDGCKGNRMSLLELQAKLARERAGLHGSTEEAP